MSLSTFDSNENTLSCIARHAKLALLIVEHFCFPASLHPKEGLHLTQDDYRTGIN